MTDTERLAQALRDERRKLVESIIPGMIGNDAVSYYKGINSGLQQGIAAIDAALAAHDRQREDAAARDRLSCARH